MLIDQLTPHLPKDNKEVNAHVKHIHVMLNAATVVDPALDCDGEARGHEQDHRQSPHRDSASSLTPLEEHSQRRGRDDRDLCDIICVIDAHGWIENRHQEHERLEQEWRDKRDYD
jgi:hypothetical protein